MSIKEIQIQDKDGNIYHPSTNSTVVKYNDITVQEKITDLDKTLENIKAGTSSNTIDKKYSYDVLIENDDQIKVEIPYEYFDKDTDSLDVFINGLAVPDNYYTVTNPANNQKGYITLTDSRSKGTIIKFIIHKNVPAGDEGSISGSILKKNSIPADRVQGLSNPNLLINGNFRNPINQRNKTEYIVKDSNNYTIDRWNAWAGGPNNSLKTTITNKGLKFEKTGEESVSRIRQAIEQRFIQSNSKITISLKILDVIGEFFVYVLKGPNINDYGTAITLNTLSFSKDGVYSLTVNTNEMEDNMLIVDINCKNIGSSVTIEWIKAEYGDKATPFVPRLYAEELAICKRYYIPFVTGFETGHFTDRISYSCILPCQMRIKPSIESATIYGNSIAVDSSGFTYSVDFINSNLITISALKNNHGIDSNSITHIDVKGIDSEIY